MRALGVPFLIAALFLMPLNSQAATDQSFSDYKPQIQEIYKEIAKTQNWFRNLLISSQHPTQHLRVVSYNLGLLYTHTATTPNYPRRSELLGPVFGKFLQDESPDVLMLQELWHEKDLKTMLEVADTHGYLVAYRDYKQSRIKHHGMQILVKADILAPGTGLEDVKMQSYGHRAVWEARYLGNVYRGLLSGYITLKNGKRILLGDTHLTPLPSFAGVPQAYIRVAQIGKLVEFLSSRFNNPNHPTNYVFMSGDFNAGPDIDLGSIGEEENRQVFVDFYNKSHLVDTYRAANPVKEEQLIPSWPWDLQISPSERIDFVYVGSGINDKLVLPSTGNLFYVTGSDFVMDQPIENDIYLSDHPAVMSDVELFER